MPSNYDNAAYFYDRLSRIIFGNKLVQSQVYLLQYIPAFSNILIVGGGTGWILEEIAKIHSSGLSITYAEISPKMSAIARKRNFKNNKVEFIEKAVERISFMNTFDVIITPFLFDSFTEPTLNNVFLAAHSVLKPGGIWLCTDFQLTGRLWQKILLNSMFVFFKVLCSIETMHLPGIPDIFEKYGYNKIASKNFYSDFIFSAYYQKSVVHS